MTPQTGAMPESAYKNDDVFTDEMLAGISGLRINPETFSKNFDIWRSSNDNAALSGEYKKGNLHKYFEYCGSHELLKNSGKIDGADLRKAGIHYSRDGHEKGVYLIKSIRDEQTTNLKNIIAGICKINSVNTTNRLWGDYFAGPNDYNRNLIMKNYMRIVKYTADRIYGKLPDKVELDDLISAGVFGLMDAIDAFDPERGVKFETYCTPRIRGAILDELRSMDWVPRLVRICTHQLENATNTLEGRLGRIPTDEEVAGELELEISAFEKLKREAHATGVVSLSNKFSELDGDKDVYEIDTIKNKKSTDPYMETQKKYLKYMLTEGLTRTERLIIILYYYEEMSMKEIGETIDLSESRISQMHTSIIDRLKAKLHGEEGEMMGRRLTNPHYLNKNIPLCEFVRKETEFSGVKESQNYVLKKMHDNPDVIKLVKYETRKEEAKTMSVYPNKIEPLRDIVNKYIMDYLEEKKQTDMSFSQFMVYLRGKGISENTTRKIISEHPELKKLIDINPRRINSTVVFPENFELLTDKIMEFAK